MMMFGMFAVGLMLLLLVVVLPIVLIILLLTGGVNLLQGRHLVNAQSQYVPTRITNSQTGSIDKTVRQCLHCGAALQPGWNHCPQCGAPIQ
jgi:hypothetical protein